MLMMKEYMDPLDLANYCAKMSCPKWNRSLLDPKTRFSKALKKIVDKYYELSRFYYRTKCWSMAQAAWESGENSFWAMFRGSSGIICTYPWPYSDKKFADWDREDDALVYDPSGSVIRDSTSYCAWKIYEKTGQWPNKNRNFHFLADSWLYFLQQAGYITVRVRPTHGHYYVAIDPHEGNTGMVYWVEGINRHGDVVATTYRDQLYTTQTILEKDFDRIMWVEIT